MIALALLCGCDYDEGINGVGKEAALKLFKVTEDSEILERYNYYSIAILIYYQRSLQSNHSYDYLDF